MFGRKDIFHHIEHIFLEKVLGILRLFFHQVNENAKLAQNQHTVNLNTNSGPANDRPH